MQHRRAEKIVTITFAVVMLLGTAGAIVHRIWSHQEEEPPPSYLYEEGERVLVNMAGRLQPGRIMERTVDVAGGTARPAYLVRLDHEGIAFTVTEGVLSPSLGSHSARRSGPPTSAPGI